MIWLNLENKSLKISSFPKEDFYNAQILYNALENETRKRSNADVVLVSLDDFKQMQKAYPNYYLDCHYFIRTLEELMKES